MKSKKSLRVIAAIVGVISVFVSFGFVSAFGADETTTTKLYASKPAAIAVRAVETTIDFVTVKKTADDKETPVAATDIEKVEVKRGSEKLESGVKIAGNYGYTFNKDKGTIVFYESDAMAADDSVVDEYSVQVFTKDNDKDGKGKEGLPATVVSVRAKAEPSKYLAVTDPSFSAKFDAAQTKINGATATSSKSVTLPFDEISELVVSPVLQKSALKYTLYYQSPNSTTFTSKSPEKGAIPKLSVSADGDYRFYVLVSDDFGNELSVKDAEIKEINGVVGYYDKTDNLIAPIFSYSYTDAKAIEITASGDSGKGRVKQRYQNLTLTVKNASDVTFTLQYNPNSGDVNDEGWVNAVKDKQAKFDADSFTASQLYFTPLVKGYFRFEVTAKGGKTGVETLTEKTGAISVQNEVEVLKLENETLKNFFKNNRLSVLFLGIAVLCLVGIIVVACWKPSDKPAKTEKGKKAKEETAEVIEAEDAEALPVAEAGSIAIIGGADGSEAEEATEPAEEATEEVAAPAEEKPETDGQPEA